MEKNKKQIKGEPHVLAGKVRCKECGSPMYRSSSQNHIGKIYVYLRCSLFIKSQKKDCTSHMVRYEVLEDYVNHQIRERIARFPHDKKVQEWNVKKTLEEKEMESQKSILLGKEEELKKQVLTLYIDRVKGFLTDEEFYVGSRKNEKKKNHVEKEKRKIERWEQEKAKTNELHLTRSCLCHFVDYILVGEKEESNQEFIIYWN